MTLRNSLALLSLSVVATALMVPMAQAAPTPLKLVVTSNQDTVQADDGLTLREAIELANGSLSRDRLSASEQAQVSAGSGTSQIGFNLPAGQTTIQLTSVLPPIESPGLVIDGTTQSGYDGTKSAINEMPMPVPIVALTPASGAEVFRGLTIAADGVVVRGLSLYGFTANHRDTAVTPPADIFIAHRMAPPIITKHPTPANFSPFYKDDLPPKDVVIENNWLGIPPSKDGTAQPAARSAFGVSVFNGSGTKIQNNWIANHDGSGIITSANAQGMLVTGNVITANGLAGMPDGIRLEGEIAQSKITGNLICGNDGSGVYLFKPNGATEITDNKIYFNGRRLRRSAVYLMGNNHKVTQNVIHQQTGPGVTIASYPPSSGNIVQENRFSSLEGLSIDLVTEWGSQILGTGIYDYQRGDGHNPKRNSSSRKIDTANRGIHAPEFASRNLALNGSSVQVEGKADPDSKIDFYRVVGTEDVGFGPLNIPVGSTTAGSDGKFTATLNEVNAGEQISAIATLPDYGTSEPARNARVGEGTPTPEEKLLPYCTTPFAEKPPEPPTEPVTLKVPKVIHFALDKDFISPASAQILDKIVQVLQANPTVTVDIIGHTDPRASDEYNLDLGRRRALNARNYLIQRGISAARMTIRSEGERQRTSQGSTRLDFARDRRAEFDYQEATGIEVIVQEDDLQIEP